MEDKNIEVEQILTEQDLLQQQIYEKSLRMQEIEALIEKYEYYNDDMDIEQDADDLIVSLKKESKVIKEEIKVLKKENPNWFLR